MDQAKLQMKQQEWANEIKNLMVEIQVGKSAIREKESRITFLNGAIAAFNDQLQEMNATKAPDWPFKDYEEFVTGWDRAWEEVVQCMNRAMRRAAKKLSKGTNGAHPVP